MTQEEKAKRYDELLLKLQKAKVDNNVCDEMYYRVIDDIVPELAKSEDEKIRKAIHIYFDWLDGRKDYQPKGEYTIRDMIAWLENQGEQKQDPCDNCKDVMLNCHNFPCVKKRAFKQGKSVFDIINEEKVDNANKAETKFKVGDFVVIQETTYLISKIEGLNVTLSLNGREGIFDMDVLRNAHLYTIADAKDGDVLNSPSHHLIWIYKDNKHYYACVNMNYVTENVAIDGLISIPNDACPATKEQRKQLEKAMADAGYAFDFERKELKRIEDKIEIPFGSNDSELQEATYYIPKGFHAEIDGDKVVIRKGEKTTAWSEEDKEILDQLINFFVNMELPADHDFRVYASWLKSLQPQSTWKPSDEQIKALEYFVRGIGESGYFSPYENNTKLLYSLLEDLRKLK